MRISGNSSIDTISSMSKNVPKVEVSTNSVSDNVPKITVQATEPIAARDSSEEIKQKVQEAVTKMNEMLEVNNNASRFMYHEGLDRYYVTVVDSQTDEIVKEIPPKKLLDAFYEMQKMLGMIVDKKI